MLQPVIIVKAYTFADAAYFIKYQTLQKVPKMSNLKTSYYKKTTFKSFNSSVTYLERKGIFRSNTERVQVCILESYKEERSF